MTPPSEGAAVADRESPFDPDPFPAPEEARKGLLDGLARQPIVVYGGSALVLAGAALTIAAPQTAGLPGLVFLGGIVCLGILGLLASALSAREVRLSRESLERLYGAPAMARRARTEAAAALDRAPVACLVTGPEGEAVYANPAYHTLFPTAVDGDRMLALDEIFRDDPDVAASLFKLVRRLGANGAERTEMPLSDAARVLVNPGRGPAGSLEIDVKALGPGGGLFWEMTPIAPVPQVPAPPPRLVERPQVPLDLLPGGVMVFDGAGHVRFANARLRTWLSVDETAAAAEGGDALTRLVLSETAGLHDSELRTFRASLRCTDGVLRHTRWDVRKLAQAPAGIETAPGESLYLALVAEADAAPGEIAPTADEPQEADEDRFWRQGFFDQAPVGILLLDGQDRILRVNPAFLARLSRTAADFVGMAATSLFAQEDRPGFHTRLQALAAETETESALPIDVRLAGPGDRSAQIFARSLDGRAGEARSLLYVVETTELKQLELQFVQSQKMQAIGQLAGGIAHDFNNLLTAIIGYCDLLLVTHTVGDPSFADISQIKHTANRAANLVSKLLAFSRRQTLMPSVLNLTDTLTDTKFLLKHLLGEKVRLKLQHMRDLGLVKVDQSQLEQVIVNLAVNARDAMPAGGTLTIRTMNVSAAEIERAGLVGVEVRDYVQIEVADTGTGMPKEVLAKIFEPFFTTKPTGEGTGLGLSTVYGIVRQTGGHIHCDSELGQGTVFRILLPRHIPVAGPAPQRAVDRPKAKDTTGAGKILLVEDEDAVRTFAVRALETKGYKVISADNGETALELIAEAGGDLDLLITDVVMPTMDGPTMVKTALESHPDLKVIFISGYAEDVFEKSVGRPEAFNFLPKPFSLKQLAEKVKEVLSA